MLNIKSTDALSHRQAIELLLPPKGHSMADQTKNAFNFKTSRTFLNTVFLNLKSKVHFLPKNNLTFKKKPQFLLQKSFLCLIKVISIFFRISLLLLFLRFLPVFLNQWIMQTLTCIELFVFTPQKFDNQLEKFINSLCLLEHDSLNF